MQSQIIVDRFLRSELSLKYQLNVYERMLLVILASYTGNKEECYPSHQSLALYCSMSTDSIRRYTKSLENKNLILINRITGNNNLYKLCIPIESPTASSTTRSQQAPADSSNHSLLTAPTPTADSSTNNIINNIREYTSAPQTQSADKTKKTQFPDEMQIGATHKQLAIEFDLDVEAELINFKEYHLSKGSKFARWDMAFNTWLRNAHKFKTQSSNNLGKLSSNFAGAL